MHPTSPEKMLMERCTSDHKMTYPILPPRQAIQAHLDGRLSGTLLLRSFMTYDHWHIPAVIQAGSEVASRIALYEMERWFELFTDHEAMKAYEAVHGEMVLGDHFVTATGVSAFGWLDGSLDGVNINPNSSLAIHYRQHQIPMLKSWATIVQLEQAIYTPEAVENPFEVIKAFQNYHIVLHRFGDQHQIVLAPNSQGRRLPALFTAEDTRDSFLAYLKQISPESFSEIRMLTLNGDELFSQLRGIPVDGIIFNPKGDLPPKAFAPQLIDHILATE
jgi:hypothetical protein